VITVYFQYSLRERNLLKSQIDQGKELQRSVYQSDVLKEIGERIGYSFDVAKMVEIITSSLGNLLEYDVVAYVVIKEGEEKFSYKCHINNSVSHTFLESVKQKILQSLSALFGQEYDKDVLDESITGNLVDDNQKVLLGSYFNVPVFISGKLVGIILVASKEKELYPAEHAQVLYSIANQAATAISKLQAVLESEKGKLVAIINSMTDGVVMIDTQNRLVVSNPAVKQILEIESKGEPTIYDLVDALAGLVDIRTKVEQAISLHSPVVEGPVKLKNHVLQLTITPVRTLAGERLGAAAVFRDITTEKDLEKLRQDFTAMMVHELRAPLTAVRWSGENILKLASGTLEPEKLKEIASNITTASKNMLELCRFELALG
jgi:K+-sensing histidine kinase KdpD